MSLPIPSTRIAMISSPRPVLFSGNQEGALGGASLAIPRMGDRFAVDVRTGQLRNDNEGRQLIAQLTRATTLDAILAIQQPNLPSPAALGAPLIDGAGQAGSILNIKGMASGALIVVGRFFSIIHGGRRYVHMVAADTLVTGAGKAVLPIWPMLRFLTAGGEVCEFAQPYIEGQLVGFDKGATFERWRTNPIDFSIVERA